MEPITLTATAIATLIFSKALEKAGEQLGEGVSNKIRELLSVIRKKFQQEGVEGKLTKAQEEPNEKNKSRFEQELTYQMEDDETFAKQLKELVEQIKAGDEKVSQIILSEIELSGDLKAQDINQKATHSGTVEQEMLKQVKAQNIDVGNLNQEA